MPEIALAGCRSDSLLGYLKALGILRITSLQFDPTARGFWPGMNFALETALPAEDLERTFVDQYAPTPIVSPWNNSTGFDGKGDRPCKVMDEVRSMSGGRWKQYREALEFIDKRYIRSGSIQGYLDSNGKIDKEKKASLISDLRTQCPEAMLPWLDAALLLTREGLQFPYLLGSGGNDGRLDFSVNFAERALEVCTAQNRGRSAALLHDALYETSEAPLMQGAAIGQFSIRHAGGVNATTGFGAESLVNAWDYLLMMEGALLFNGGIGRRTAHTRGGPVFPFAVGAVAAGYGTASSEEATRGEMWLPVWSGRATLRSISDLLRKGRIDMPLHEGRTVVRNAALASEAATAVVTMGVPLGLSRFQRVAFAQRNGLAFAATAVGTIAVGERYDDGIAVVSQTLATWIERVGRMPAIGKAARDALHRVEEAFLDFPNTESTRKKRARQDLLVAVVDIDRALVVSGRGDENVPPLLPSSVSDWLDDGSAAHQVAIAIASLGPQGEHAYRLRRALRASSHEPVSLSELLERLARLDAGDAAAGWLRPHRYTSTLVVSQFLAFDRRERARFYRLLRAYTLIRPADEVKPAPTPTRDDYLPASYALLKVVFDSRVMRDERIPRLLSARNPKAALELAARRARAVPELPGRPRDVSSVQISDPAWLATALLCPIAYSRSAYAPLLRAALRSVDEAKIDSYLDSIKERNYQ